jgi:hypothetical protein
VKEQIQLLCAALDQMRFELVRLAAENRTLSASKSTKDKRLAAEREIVLAKERQLIGERAALLRRANLALGTSPTVARQAKPALVEPKASWADTFWLKWELERP